ncbi:MAG TPA: IclR family transcriptional regulator [Castellaniella sp.]|uniref:IclR family transcriptional regulator n=1 Tax=Castellaniella sp. TaxID=1955812 RepID=UPI002EE9339C
MSARPAGTAAFSKFVHLLQLVADSDHPCTVPELVHLSGYPRATVYRTVAGLVAERLLATGLGGKTYVLGPRLIELASRSWDRSELRRVALDELVTLRDVTRETIHLAVPNDLNMVYIDKLESPKAVRMASRIGASVSLHSTAVGKAYLAALGEASCARIVSRLEFYRYTSNTVDSIEALQDQLRVIRQRGWSQDDEENEEGIRCFGAVIVDGGGQPVAAVSVSTLRFRQKPDPRQAYVAPLLAACAAISRRIGSVPGSAYRCPKDA